MFSYLYRLLSYTSLITGTWQYRLVEPPNIDSYYEEIVAEEYPKIQPRILGGDSVYERYLYSYQVSIQIKQRHLCGGAILDSRWILTAAHCVLEKDIVIVAGTNDLADHTNAIYYYPQEVIVHCNYDNPEFANDIALIRTHETIPLSSTLKAVPLGNRFPFKTGKLFLTGWGAIRHSQTEYGIDDYPTLLQSLEFRGVPFEDCNQAWLMSGGIDAGNVCALNDIHKGACSGDSGSPMTHRGKIVAVASYVMSCAKGLPDVFASVPYYLDFIRTTMRTCEEGFLSGENTSSEADKRRKKRSILNSSGSSVSAQRTKYHTISIRYRNDLGIRSDHAWRRSKQKRARHGIQIRR